MVDGADGGDGAVGLVRASAGGAPVVGSLRRRHARGQLEPQLGIVGRQVLRAHPAALDQQLTRPAGFGDDLTQPGAGQAQAFARQRAVADLVEQGLQRVECLGVGGVPFGQELLVLLLEQHVHRDPAVGQRRGHPPFLKFDVTAAGDRVGGRQQVGIDGARGQLLLQVGDQPGVHLRGELAALGLLVPDMQADYPVRLGSGGFQPGPDVTDGGVAVRDLAQDGFGGRPEHGGQRVGRREHPSPQARQRGQSVLRRYGEQRKRHIAPGQVFERSVGQLGHAISFKGHARSVRSLSPSARLLAGNATRPGPAIGQRSSLPPR